MKKVIEELFAFVANDDGEGVIGMRLPNGEWFAFVGADMERVFSLIPMANKISKMTGIPYRILRFSKREDITEKMKGV